MEQAVDESESEVEQFEEEEDDEMKELEEEEEEKDVMNQRERYHLSG